MVRGAQLLGVALLVAGCTTASTATYNAADVGQPIETTKGRVLAARVVEIAGDATGLGSIAGAALGAPGLRLTLGKQRGSGLTVVSGGLLGAGIGYLAERWLRGGEGIEYVVETNDGRIVTMVQRREGGEEPLPDGTPVLVQMGAMSSRVMAHPRAGRVGGGAADWVNPDTVPADAPSAPPMETVIGPLQRQQQ